MPNDLLISSSSLLHSDIRIDINGDFVVQNRDMMLVSEEDLISQEIKRVFREKVHINNYIGTPTTGIDGEVLAETITEDIMLALISHPLIDDDDIAIDICPLPDNMMSIDITSTVDPNRSFLSEVMDFNSSTLEGLSRNDNDINTVYDTNMETITQIEFVNIDTKTNEIKLSHHPSEEHDIQVFRTDSGIEINEDGELENLINEGTSEEIEKDSSSSVDILQDGIEITYDKYEIDSVFPDLNPVFMNYKIQEVTAVDQDEEEIQIIYNQQDYPDSFLVKQDTEFDHIIITIIYSRSTASGASIRYESMVDDMAYGKRFIYPLDRMFNIAVAILPAELTKGNYVVQYNRYPNRKLRN